MLKWKLVTAIFLCRLLALLAWHVLFCCRVLADPYGPWLVNTSHCLHLFPRYRFESLKHVEYFTNKNSTTNHYPIPVILSYVIPIVSPSSTNQLYGFSVDVSRQAWLIHDHLPPYLMAHSGYLTSGFAHCCGKHTCSQSTSISFLNQTHPNHVRLVILYFIISHDYWF